METAEEAVKTDSTGATCCRLATAGSRLVVELKPVCGNNMFAFGDNL